MHRPAASLAGARHAANVGVLPPEDGPLYGPGSPPSNCRRTNSALARPMAGTSVGSRPSADLEKGAAGWPARLGLLPAQRAVAMDVGRQACPLVAAERRRRGDRR